jgi:Tol biopolymer transport system component
MCRSKRLTLIIFVIPTFLAIISCVKENPIDGDTTSYRDGLIAYTAYNDTFHTDLDIYLVDSYAYNPIPENVSNSVSIDCYPEWLYDKSALIYLSRSGNQSALFKVDPINLGGYIFFSSADSIIKISTSPTEAKLAYFKIAAGQQAVTLNILNIETLDTVQLSSLTISGDYQVAWSKDGTKLAVKAGVILVFNTQNNSLLYSVGFTGEYFAWDESGDKLYVIRSGDLYLADTLQQQAVLIQKGLAYPAISTDRRYLACLSRTDGNALIIVDLGFHDYVTVKYIQVPPLAYGDSRIIDWSPDSREIAFIDYVDGKWNIFVADRTGLDPVEQITDDVTLKNALCQ